VLSRPLLSLLVVVLCVGGSAAAVTKCIKGLSALAVSTPCLSDALSCSRIDTTTTVFGNSVTASVYACVNQPCSLNLYTGGKTGCVQQTSSIVACCCESDDCNSKSVSQLRVKKCAGSFDCLAAGADCYDDKSACGQGLYCDSTDKCAAVPTTCSSSSDCKRSGSECVSGACKLVQRVGGNCNAGADRCPPTSSPWTTNTDCPASGTCPGLVAGDTCAGSCSYGFYCASGTCVAETKPTQVALGQPCTEFSYCAGAASCLYTTNVCTAHGTQADGVDIGVSSKYLCKSLDKSGSKCVALDTTTHWKTCPIKSGTTSTEVQKCGSNQDCDCVTAGATAGRCVLEQDRNPEVTACASAMETFKECTMTAACQNFRDPHDGTMCPACCSQLKDLFDCMGSKKMCTATTCSTYDAIGLRDRCNLSGCDIGAASSLSASVGLVLFSVAAAAMLFA